MIQVYKSLKKYLSTQIVGVGTIDLFNNQFQNLKDNESEEDIIIFPAVLIEFMPVDWTSNSTNIQDGKATIRLHIGLESYSSTTSEVIDGLEFLSFVESVYVAVQGWVARDEAGKALASSMDRIQSVQDTNHDALWVMQEAYSLTIYDEAAAIKKRYVEATAELKEQRDKTITTTKIVTP
jgi:hypothetical protein